MPELPEVETVRRVLESWCINQEVKKIYVYYNPITNNLSEEEFNLKLSGQKIVKINRVGKFLVFHFDNYTMLSHLRMEGKWHYGHFKSNELIKDGISFDPFDRKSKDSKHVHFAIEFKDGHLLMYHDVRKFGRIQLFDNEDCYFNEPLNKLGYEPFNELISVDFLKSKFKNLKVTIKEALLDQSILVGLGNIYCDEVLFATKILPSTLAKDVDENKYSSIINESIRILTKAIELGGSTIKSYHAANSVDGKFQNALLVYGKENEKCVDCGSLIFKSRIGGRGTHFCPKCQKSNVKNRVIGVTGVIGSGKSLVSSLINIEGYELLDADLITRNAQKKDGELYLKIISLFKKHDILLIDKELNREKIREIILNDELLNIKLKEIVHKYVYRYIMETIFKNPNKKFVLDVPLLYESHINEICDNIIIVSCNDEILKGHILKRDTMPIDDALKLKEKQLSSLTGKEYDYLIENNESKEVLKSKILTILESINLK